MSGNLSEAESAVELELPMGLNQTIFHQKDAQSPFSARRLIELPSCTALPLHQQRLEPVNVLQCTIILGFKWAVTAQLEEHISSRI